jgi:glycosyltransferase involved in cell wall biosynthesis
MRVLSVSNFFDTHGGGLERVAGHLCREFARAGHKAAWAASDADGLPDSPAEILSLRCANPTEALTGLPMPLPGPRSIARLYRAIGKSDLVVIHDALYVTSIWAMLFAKLRNKPTVLVQHIAAIPFANPVMKALMQLANFVVTRPMMASTDTLAFISKTVQDDLMGPTPRRRSLLLFNGVDNGIFAPADKLTQGVGRDHWGLPTGKPVAIFVGRFVEKKGLNILRSIASKMPEVHFALVGKGPINPVEWGMPNVHVLGQQGQHEIAELYRLCDLLILPSVGEGYPLVIQEAMACGLPVVCGEQSALADPGATQWLNGVDIDLSDVEVSATRCATTVQALLGSHIDTTAMARYAARNYSWQRMADAIIATAPAQHHSIATT